MREIMFRGKCTDGGAWVWGKGIDVNSNDAYILQGWMDCDTGICGVDEIEVVPKTVGQYTGLTDESGEKIFEGDIVEITYKDEVGLVKWIEDGAAFAVVCDDTDDTEEESFLINLFGRDVRVIGNVHDDPELLMRAVE